jgi:hypothetical protein
MLESIARHASRPDEEYRYPRFKRHLLMEDMAFIGGPAPGAPFPDFTLHTLAGERVEKEDLVGSRPVLFMMGSVTCPMTAAASPIFQRLYREFGQQVRFITLYVREAHPGDDFPQAGTLEQKLAHARAYARRDRIPWQVLVDTPEGALHRQLDPKPNAVYVMAPDGTVAFRSLWANDERVMRRALGQLTDGMHLPLGEAQPRLVPMMSGLGCVEDMLELSGGHARDDLRREAPPMYAMARLAGLFRPLSPGQRTMAAMATSALAVWALSRLWRAGQEAQRPRLQRP